MTITLFACEDTVTCGPCPQCRYLDHVLEQCNGIFVSHFWHLDALPSEMAGTVTYTSGGNTFVEPMTLLSASQGYCLGNSQIQGRKLCFRSGLEDAVVVSITIDQVTFTVGACSTPLNLIRRDSTAQFVLGPVTLPYVCPPTLNVRHWRRACTSLSPAAHTYVLQFSSAEMAQISQVKYRPTSSTLYNGTATKLTETGNTFCLMPANEPANCGDMIYWNQNAWVIQITDGYTLRAVKITKGGVDYYYDCQSAGGCLLTMVEEGTYLGTTSSTGGAACGLPNATYTLGQEEVIWRWNENTGSVSRTCKWIGPVASCSTQFSGNSPRTNLSGATNRQTGGGNAIRYLNNRVPRIPIDLVVQTPAGVVSVSGYARLGCVENGANAVVVDYAVDVPPCTAGPIPTVSGSVVAYSPDLNIYGCLAQDSIRKMRWKVTVAYGIGNHPSSTSGCPAGTDFSISSALVELVVYG